MRYETHSKCKEMVKKRNTHTWSQCVEFLFRVAKMWTALVAAAISRRVEPLEQESPHPPKKALENKKEIAKYKKTNVTNHLQFSLTTVPKN